jgi:ribosome maturation protein SDO1
VVRIDEAIVVAYEKNGVSFEVLVDPNAVLDYREGKNVDARSALAVFEIFRDARKADKAGEADMVKAFGFSETEGVALEIMKKGEFHPTTEQKRQMLEKVRKQVIEMIVKNAVDPRTNLPHTRDRINWAIEEAKVKIDLRAPSQQVNEVVKEIRLVLPMRFGTAKLRVIVPSAFAHSIYGKIRSLGKVTRESWLANGSLQAVIEVPSGMKVDVITELGNFTKGEAIVKEEE